MKDLEFHEAANIFPLDDEHVDELAKDIEKHGQHVAIQILDGKILDGRRRWLACRKANIIPTTSEVETDDPVAYVLSLNLHRRHLSPTQLGMVAGRARGMYDRAAKERMKGGQGGKLLGANFPEAKGRARDQAAKAVGISGKTVDLASRVLRRGIPELIVAVDADKIAVSTAANVSSKSPAEQKAFVDQAKGRPAGRRLTQIDPELKANKVRGMGVARANEAIDCLKRIPKNDALRKRGFQIVTDWIRHNQ